MFSLPILNHANAKPLGGSTPFIDFHGSAHAACAWYLDKIATCCFPNPLWIKAAAAKSFKIAQLSRVAATIATLRDWAADSAFGSASCARPRGALPASKHDSTANF